MPKFGFTPSGTLLHQIQYGLRVKNSGEALAPLRYEIAVLLYHELIEVLLLELAKQLPHSASNETILKLAQYLQSQVELMLEPLQQQVSNKIAKATIEFYGHSLFKDANRQYRIGFDLDPRLSTSLVHHLNSLSQGERISSAALVEYYQQAAEAIAGHFLTQFAQTLAFNMPQAKQWDTALGHLLTMTYSTLEKIIVSLNRNELKILADHHLLQLQP